ncbi:MAG: nuclease-related domain-containing protein [bacterium]
MVNFDDLTQRISALSDNPAIQRLSQLFLEWEKDDKTVLYILLTFAVGFIIGRYRAYRSYGTTTYQNRGEAMLSRALLSNFGSPDYYLMNHITLHLKDGTTQVDHILVSRFGVFVIETKDYRGWIFASTNQANWTQVMYKRKFKFQNPIFQNFGHVQAVQSLLDFLPHDNIYSAVVFTGEAEFKTEIPQGVFTLPGFIEYLRKQTTEVMSLNRVQFCVGRLETARLAVSGQTDVEHVGSLKRRHGKTG